MGTPPDTPNSPPQTSNAENLPPQTLRLLCREVSLLSADPPDGIKVFPNDEDVTDVQVAIEGPGRDPRNPGGTPKVPTRNPPKIPLRSKPPNPRWVVVFWEGFDPEFWGVGPTEGSPNTPRIP